MQKYGKLSLLGLAILVGAISTLYWVYPQIEGSRLGLSEAYLPIRHGIRGGVSHDDYFYYAYVQDVLAGQWFSLDPTTYDGFRGTRVSAHLTYGLSLALGALGGLLTGKVEHAYLFNLFFFPFLTLLLMAWLAFKLTGSEIATFAVCVLGARYMPEISRMPHPMITAVPLILEGLLLHRLWNQKSDWKTQAALILLVGISPLCSVTDFFLSYCVLGVFLLSSWFRPLLFRTFLKIAIGAFLLSLPVLLILFIHRPVFKEILEAFAYRPVEMYFTIKWGEWIRDSLSLVGPLILFSLFPFSQSDFVLRSFAGFFLAYLTLGLVQGSFTAAYVARENLPFSLTLLFSGIFLIIRKVMESGRWPILGKLAQNRALALVTLVLLTAVYARGAILYTLSEAKLSVEKRFDPEFRALANWAQKNTRYDDVALTLDFEAGLNLINYAPMNMYLPQGLLSPFSEKAIDERFFQLLRAFEVSPARFSEWLRGNATPNRELMKFYLYYGRYNHIDIDEHKKQELISEYTRRFPNLNEPPHRFTHFILSQKDDISQSLPQVLRNQVPVFKNSRYEVYRASEEPFRGNSKGR